MEPRATALKILRFARLGLGIFCLGLAMTGIMMAGLFGSAAAWLIGSDDGGSVTQWPWRRF